MSAQVLIQDLTRLGIQLIVKDGRLRYSPQSAMTPALAERLKAHKGELLSLLQSRTPAIDPDDLQAVWRAVTDELEGDPLFTPDLLEALRAARVRLETGDLPDSGTPTKPAPAVCRCGSVEYVDTPIHEGQSTRRDCGR